MPHPSNIYIFSAGVPTDPAKTVRAVTLPSTTLAPLNSSISGMHFFAIAVGG